MVEQTQVIVLRGLEGNELISTGYVQNLLQPYVSGIIALLWVIWFSILIFILIYDLIHLPFMK